MKRRRRERKKRKRRERRRRKTEVKRKSIDRRRGGAPSHDPRPQGACPHVSQAVFCFGNVTKT